MYIANKGFLIKVSNKKILIDALFGRFEADWCDIPTGEIIEKMEKGQDPDPSFTKAMGCSIKDKKAKRN